MASGETDSRWDQHMAGGQRAASKKPTAAKWQPTGRTVKHKGAVRKLWRSTSDASAVAVKRIVKSADGTRKVRYERLP